MPNKGKYSRLINYSTCYWCISGSVPWRMFGAGITAGHCRRVMYAPDLRNVAVHTYLISSISLRCTYSSSFVCTSFCFTYSSYTTYTWYVPNEMARAAPWRNRQVILELSSYLSLTQPRVILGPACVSVIS